VLDKAERCIAACLVPTVAVEVSLTVIAVLRQDVVGARRLNNPACGKSRHYVRYGAQRSTEPNGAVMLTSALNLCIALIRQLHLTGHDLLAGVSGLMHASPADKLRLVADRSITRGITLSTSPEN